MVNIKQLISTQKKFYTLLKPIRCPVLNATVFFTSRGFRHLTTSNNRIPRPLKEQIMKLKCLSSAPEVIKYGDKIAEVRQVSVMIKGKKKVSTRTEVRSSKNEDVGVVIERIGGGKYHFLSVLTFRKHNSRTKKKRPERRS